MSELLTQRPESEHPLSDGLDFYKLTMGQVALERYPDAEVTFTMKNRAGDYPLARYVDTDVLRARFKTIIEKGFQPEEIAYLAGLQTQQGEARFDEQYLEHLANLTLTDVDIRIDESTNDLAVSAKGPWANVSLWETVVMSEVNEHYYRALLKEQGVSIDEAWAEGNRRLDEKIAILHDRPDIKFADFGTRRRFSADWQSHVIGRLKEELPDNLIGTSNPWFAYKYGIAPIGTYAHEMPMVYGALADKEGKNPLNGHSLMMREWFDRYDKDLSIALTDTFTSDFFFDDFTPEQAKDWRGLRHDSGDPFTFGEQVIDFYEQNEVDPRQKTLIFSDGLDIDMIIRLADRFMGRINVVFGWGTSLMNDLGFRANNFVMKATNVDGVDTVKLSDNEGKHTGPQTQVERYIALKDARLGVEKAFQEMATA
jgi:nicotinate phosphoribosyltransferase